MKNIFKKIISVFSAAVIAASALCVPASAETYKAEKLPDNEAIKFVDSMGAGWNLGNAFDASNCTWLSNKLDYESAWNGAKTTKKLIRSVKEAGFSTIRVPVSWHNHVDSNLNIDKEWMDRVKEVIDWCLDEDLYVIINVHHDVENGFYYPTKAELKSSKNYMEKIWKQISDTFKDYDEKLIFETINEPRLKGANYEWWYPSWNISDEVKESLECVNELNQVSLDTIRKSGGNNATRFVLIGGYDTSDLDTGILVKQFSMPKDSAKDRLIADVHCYSFNMNDIKSRIDKVYNAFVAKGIPAVYTEYGMHSDGFDYSSNEKSAEIISGFAAYARSKGISVILWDNNAAKQFKFIDRATGKLTEKEIISAFVKAGAPSNPVKSTGKKSNTSKTSSSKPEISIKSNKKGEATISWKPVEGATRYAVYKYADKKLKLINGKVSAKSSGTQKYTVKDLKSGKKYSYAVKAYVNGKWTSVKKADIKTVKVK